MDPLVSLYYYAPVCAALNFVLMLLIEGIEPFYHLERVGAFVLFTNAGVAFALNVSVQIYVGVGIAGEANCVADEILAWYRSPLSF